MKFGSLFAGIGGFERGLMRAGHSIEWSIERDPFRCGILRRRFSTLIVEGDAKDVDWRLLAEVKGLCGGFPCKDLANSGVRTGITGQHSSAWEFYAEAIEVLKPEIVVIENVPGLLSAGFDAIVALAMKEGYSVEWDKISAQTFGAPQLRERVWIVLHRSSSPFVFDSDVEHSGIVKYPQAFVPWHIFPRAGFIGNDGLELTKRSVSAKRRKAMFGGLTSRVWGDFGPNVDYERLRRTNRLSGQLGGIPTTEFAEWIMGYPIGWTGEDEQTQEIDWSMPPPRPWIMDHRTPIYKQRIAALGDSLCPPNAEFIGRMIER